MTTQRFKNYTLFIFAIFFIREPILIIFGKSVAKEIGNMQSLKPRLHQGNKIVASLLPVCCWIQIDTCCRDTGNILPTTSNMLPGNLLQWCKRGFTCFFDSSNVLQLRTSWCIRKHVVFNVEDCILVESLYKFKGYRAKK